jgi:hypothetical protein
MNTCSLRVNPLLQYKTGLKISDDVFTFILLPYLNEKELILFSSIDKYTYNLVEKYIIKKYGVANLQIFYKLLCRNCIRIDYISFKHPSFCSLCYTDNICNFCLNVNHKHQSVIKYKQNNSHTDPEEYFNQSSVQMCSPYCKYHCDFCKNVELISPTRNNGKTKFVWFKKPKSVIRQFGIQTNKDFNHCCQSCYENVGRTDRILYQPNRDY